MVASILTRSVSSRPRARWLLSRWCALAFLATPCIRPLAAEGESILPLTPIRNLQFHQGGATNSPLFHAIRTNYWFPGLIPIFLVEKSDHVELRRRPARGLENSSEPFFFCLPPADEPQALLIAGRWESEAIRESGSKAWPSFEFSVENDQVAARFDQDTDYRFAYISGGSWRSNELQLRIEYVAEAFTLIGRLENGRLKGSWQSVGEGEKGTWEGWRGKPMPKLPSMNSLAELYEWRIEGKAERRYGFDGQSPGQDWSRSKRPLGRVWRLNQL